ncbi:MAG: SUMF1/EgtB/PvdO family nonheme iron enzyme [Bacteroidota bacterium]
MSLLRAIIAVLLSFPLFSQQNSGLKPLRFVDFPDTAQTDLWMDETPVTYTDFEIYVRAGGMKNAYWYYESYHKPEQPVTGISWHHAVDYCNWRSACEGLEAAYELTDQEDYWGYPVYRLKIEASGYRLPFSYEFTFAALAGKMGNPYPWGRVFREELTNMDSDRGHQKTEWWRLAPVKSQYKNEFGLYNMCGNNWHWCSDWNREKRTMKLRGGSWGAIDSMYLSSAYGSHCPPGSYNYDIGFRCVRPADITALQEKPDTLTAYTFSKMIVSQPKTPVTDFYGEEFQMRLTAFLADNFPDCINFRMQVDEQEILTPGQMAELMIRVCRHHQVNPLFLASIMISESGFGTVSFPRWYNNPMAFHWQNKLMVKGLPVYDDQPGKKNRKYKNLETGFDAFCKGIRRDLYYRAAKTSLDAFHLIYVGYRADEWMLTLSRVYRDVAGVQFEPQFPARDAGMYIYSDWPAIKNR